MSRFTLRPGHPLAQGCIFASLLDHDLTDLVTGRRGVKVGGPTLITTPEGLGWQSTSGTSYVEWPDSAQFNLDRAATGVMRIRVDGTPAAFLSHDNGSGNVPKWIWGKNLGIFGFSAAPTLHLNNGSQSFSVSGADYTPVAGRYYTVAFSRLEGAWTFFLDGVPWGTASNNLIAFPSSAVTASFKVGYSENGGGLIGAFAWARLYRAWKPPAWHALITRDPYADLRTRLRGVAVLEAAPIGGLVEKTASDSISVGLTESSTLNTALASLKAHWRARDAAGAGSTLPEVIAGRNGTLTGGCSWVTTSGEPAVRCPVGEYVSVADDALWTLGDFTIIARLAAHSKISGPSGDHPFIRHGTSASGIGAWRIALAGDSESVWTEWENPSGTPRAGGGVFFSYVVDRVYSLAVTRSGTDFQLLVDGVNLGSNTGGSQAFLDIAAALTLGGRSTGDTANLSLMSLRLYDTVLPDAVIFAAMLEDAPVAKHGTDSITVGLTESATRKSKIPGVASDDFDRTLVGSEWTPVAPAVYPVVLSGNRATITPGNRAFIVYTAEEFQSDHSAQVTLAAGGSTSDYLALLLRTNPATGVGYAWFIRTTNAVLYRTNGEDDYFQLGKNVDSGVSATFAPGDVVKAAVENDASGNPSVRLYKNNVLLWTSVDTHANKITAGGSPGIGFHSGPTPWEVDDFQATGLVGELIAKTASDSISAAVTESSSLFVATGKVGTDSLSVSITESASAIEAKTTTDTLGLSLTEAHDPIVVSYPSIVHTFHVAVPQIDSIPHTFSVLSNQEIARLVHLFRVREQWGGAALSHTFRVRKAGVTTPTEDYLVTRNPGVDDDDESTIVYVATPSAPPGTSISYVTPSAPSTPLSVAVVGGAITVTLGTDASGNVISTAAEVAAAIAASTAASALVTPSLPSGSSGAALVSPMPPRALSGAPLLERDILRPVTN